MVNTSERPKIKIPKTTSEWIWDVIGYIFYLGSIVFLIIIWSDLPKEVPAHYNALGEVDRWGSKWELLILPGVGLFLLLSMQSLEFFPEIHNYPKRFNPSNARQFYLTSRKLINQLKNICLILFALILLESISGSLEWGMDGGIWMIPFSFIGLGIPIFICIVRFKKIN